MARREIPTLDQALADRHRRARSKRSLDSRQLDKEAAVPTCVSSAMTPSTSSIRRDGAIDPNSGSGGILIGNERDPLLVRKRLNDQLKNWSGWRDSNPRPLDPQSSALPGCATSR